MVRAAVLLLLVAGLAGCATRVPTASQPAYQEDYRRAIGVDLNGLDSNGPGVDGVGFPDASDAPEECRKEEDPCRKRHNVNLFLGYSTDQGENGFTLGLDYIYMVTESFGVAAFAEWVAGDFRESVLGGGVAFHPTEEVFVFVGPGVAIKKGEENKALLRLGTGYDHEIRRGWTVGPAFYVDIEEGGEAVFVLGVNIGKSWR